MPVRDRSRSPKNGRGSSDVGVTCNVVQMSGAALAPFEMDPTQRILELKSRISAVSATPISFLRLFLGNRELDDNDKTLAEEGLLKDALLTLVRGYPVIDSLFEISEDDPLLVPYLLARQADPNETEENGWTALHFVANKGHAAVAAALAECPRFTVLNGKDTGGMTPLHACAQVGLSGACRTLLNRADFTAANVRSRNGNTALHWAARGAHRQACLALLSSEGFAAVNDQNLYGWTALHYAAATGQMAVCKELLSHSLFTAARDATNNGETALHWASLNGHEDVCRLLLTVIDVNAQDVEGMTAFDEAKRAKKQRVCALLSDWMGRM